MSQVHPGPRGNPRDEIESNPKRDCVRCGREWSRIGPEGYECGRCGSFSRSDVEAYRPAPVAPPTTESFFPGGAFSAKRVADRLCEEAHFAHGGGELFVYRGGVYRPDGAAHVERHLAEMLADKWSTRRTSEVTSFLRSTSAELWDRPPPDVVNVRNGLLEVASGRLLEHTPEFLSPVQLGASFHPDATCPAIDRFVGQVFPGDATLLAYELPGYLIVPDTTLDRAVMLLGAGSNGKSTYLNLVESLLGGGDNVSATALQALDSNRFAPATLFGKLANIVADLDAAAVKSSAVFKAIVSGDRISAERKYGAPFAFRPYARLLFSANEPPPTHDTSYAYFRRWVTIPFDVVFAGAQKDRQLITKLLAPGELSGFLNRALEGLARVRAQGDFTEPASIRKAASDFRKAVDSTAEFVDAVCVIGPDLRVARPRMYETYKAWCKEVNRISLSARRFNEHVLPLLPSREHCVVKINGTEFWVGITLASLVSASEGGGRVDKVDVPPTLTPSPKESRVESSSTLSTQRPPCSHRPLAEAGQLWVEAASWGEISACACCGAPVRVALYDGEKCQLCARGPDLPAKGGHVLRALYDAELVVVELGSGAEARSQ